MLLSFSRKHKAFTIPELLVIIAIISILAVLIVMHFSFPKARSRDSKRITEVNDLRKALQMYYLDHGHYPTSTDSEDWCSLEVTDPTDPRYCKYLRQELVPNYIKDLPQDPRYPETEGTKFYSYQYVSTSSASQYKIHSDLETLPPYEVYSQEGKDIAYNPPASPPSSPSIPGGYFTFRIDTTLGGSGNTFSFQVDNASNLYIDWGDGNTTTYSGTNLLSHTYGTGGVYDISLQGQASRISFYEGTEDALIDILTPVSDGIIGLTSARAMFADTDNFGTSPLTAPDFFDEASKNITDMSFMFYYSSFNQPIGNWDVSNVTEMVAMFAGSSFNQPIGNWDVSSVTDMSWMFWSSSFNQPIGNWDVSSVTDMSWMFYRSSFNQPIGNWDVSNVTNMVWMFASSPFNQPIGNWDVSNVTQMNYMFDSSPFNQPIGNWNVSNVRNMSGMFYGSHFNQPIGNWDVSNVTEMVAMFAGSSFNQPIGNWDVSSVTDMRNMLRSSAMSRDNYDDLLIGWDSLPSLQSDVNFGVNGLKYCHGEAARTDIINKYHWNITGDSKDCS